jgi:hypothetical protein
MDAESCTFDADEYLNAVEGALDDAIAGQEALDISVIAISAFAMSMLQDSPPCTSGHALTFAGRCHLILVLATH